MGEKGKRGSFFSFGVKIWKFFMCAMPGGDTDPSEVETWRNLKGVPKKEGPWRFYV